MKSLIPLSFILLLLTAASCSDSSTNSGEPTEHTKSITPTDSESGETLAQATLSDADSGSQLGIGSTELTRPEGTTLTIRVEAEEYESAEEQVTFMNNDPVEIALEREQGTSGPVTYAIQDAFPNLSFSQPLDLQHAGDGSGRLFVVERGGTIQVFTNDESATETATFLDISSRVNTSGEGGLLGLAFHPDFQSNGFFYVNYTAGNPFRTIISRFQVSGDSDRANADSETQLLSFNQPFRNHNGGQIQFGPNGFLYIATGDGGGADDQLQNAQDRTNLFGNILRIDVDGTEVNGVYGIPDDNPFVGNEENFREEIFAYGLRNPYRFSFDAGTGDLWAGDVGQNRFEEIDLIENGDNLGWNIVEGNACFDPMEGCDMSGLTDPIFVYQQDGSQSVTGGFVYRGPTLDQLTGRYIFADFISGRLWALDISDLDNAQGTDLADTNLPISGFGEDADNELYFTAFDGNVYRIVEEES